MTAPSALRPAAEAAVQCLGVGSSDDVLVVYNEEKRVIAGALAEAATRPRRRVTSLVFPTPSRHGEEPPSEVAEAMARADVVFAPTSRSLSQTQARIQATSRGARIATLPMITEEIFVRALPVDYAELERRGGWLAARLSSASVARVTSAGGTEIELNLEGRTGRSDDGNLRRVGAFGNLPAGEAYIAPLETFGDGTIVFDGSLAGYGRLETPLRVRVQGGRAVQADGEAAEWLFDTLDAGGEHGRSLAELGIGTNPTAVLTGNVLEDEKIIGTLHIAFGASPGIGGTVAVPLHHDCVVVDATLTIGGTTVVDAGRFVL